MAAWHGQRRGRKVGVVGARVEAVRVGVGMGACVSAKYGFVVHQAE
jgi:hypothetical protein